MILRICVVIPTFNNLRSISEVVKDVVMHTQFSVLVLDDGSETPVANSLYSWEVRQALETGRVRVSRFEKNCGKGAALQFAVKELVREGFTHMLTMDGDGQHYAREIHKLVDIAVKHPWDLIIGDRKLKSTTVPKISKFGRAFSNFWVNYQTGLHIADSQSGFRLYPLLPIQTMKFFTRRYDFEIEVLIRLIWNGVHVRETEIEVFYPVKEERVSHFHKFWDNARISFLNTLLVMVSLLKTHRSPRELSLALGLGVFVGCTPFMGLHTLMIIPLALLFRLNAIIMWIGTHVSTPLLFPFVVYAQLWVAKNWLNMTPEVGFRDEFYRLLAGGLVLGLVLGIGTTVVSFVIAYAMKHRATHSNWTGRTRGGRLGNGFLKFVLKFMGLKYGYLCLRFIVPYFYLFAPKARSALNEYWRLVEPLDTWRERQVRILKHFYRFGQTLMDRVFQSFHEGKQFPTRPSGMENILLAMGEKRGLILLSAHMGGWDLAAALLPTNGFADQIHVVEYRADGLSFQKVKANADPRHLQSVNTNASRDAIFEIHSALKKGGCLGLMGDRPLGDRFELIPFLGKLAPFDMTAFRLAAATKVPLLFTFGFKGSEGHYDFFALPSKLYQYTPDEPREVQCYRWAQAYVREIEGFIRKYPSAWFNFYPFWSALPTAPSGGLGAQANNHLIEELGTPQSLKPGWGPDPSTNGEG